MFLFNIHTEEPAEKKQQRQHPAKKYHLSKSLQSTAVDKSMYKTIVGRKLSDRKCKAYGVEQIMQQAM